MFLSVFQLDDTRKALATAEAAHESAHREIHEKERNKKLLKWWAGSNRVAGRNPTWKRSSIEPAHPGFDSSRAGTDLSRRSMLAGSVVNWTRFQKSCIVFLIRSIYCQQAYALVMNCAMYAGMIQNACVFIRHGYFNYNSNLPCDLGCVATKMHPGNILCPWEHHGSASYAGSWGMHVITPLWHVIWRQHACKNCALRAWTQYDKFVMHSSNVSCNYNKLLNCIGIYVTI